MRGLARRLDVDPAVLCRPLTQWQADKYSVAIGVLPFDVWGDHWWQEGYEDPFEPGDEVDELLDGDDGRKAATFWADNAVMMMWVYGVELRVPRWATVSAGYQATCGV